MLGPTSVQRLNLVHPRLAYNITLLSQQMSEPIGVTQGLRKPAEQAALYAQGRQNLISVNSLRKVVGWAPITDTENIRVTNANVGFTWHEFGLAVDLVPFESNGQPDWDESHPVWMEIVTKGTALGMTSGKSWKDEPHLQITGRFPVTPTDEVRQIMATSGLNGVWQAAQIGSN
jgi:peptidoglycan LD-endopeptidase CwlK